MQDMLKEAYPAFLRSYEEEKVQALRVNALKGTREEFLEKASFGSLKQVPWERTDYIIRELTAVHPESIPFMRQGCTIYKSLARWRLRRT